MSGVVSEVGDVAVCSYCLTMWSDIIIEIAPGTVLTNKDADSLCKLAEPSHTSDVRTNWNTRTVACLIPILMIWTLVHAKVSIVLAELSRGFRACDYTNWTLSRDVPIEAGDFTGVSGIGKVVALRDAGTCYIVCKSGVDTKGTSRLAGTSNIFSEIQVRGSRTEKSNNTTHSKYICVGWLP